MVQLDFIMSKGGSAVAAAMFYLFSLSCLYGSEAYTFGPSPRSRAVLSRPQLNDCCGQSAFKCSRRRMLLAKPRPSYDEEFEERDSSIYDTRLVGDSDAARELQQMKYEDEEYYSDNEEDIYEEEEIEEEEPQYQYRDEYEDDEEEPVDTGNFWSNPKQGLDPNPPPEKYSRRRRRPPSTAAPHKRRPTRRPGRRSTSRTTFRSGTPSPPAALQDLYHRLFWYGFDSDDIASTSDKTVFGGSRGKFNGLEYMKQVRGEPPSRPYRQKRTPRRQPRQDRYDDDVDDFYDYEYEEDGDDYDYPDDEPRGPFQIEESRPRPRRSDRDWVSDEVSSWFIPGNDNREESGRRRKKEGSPWNILGQILNLDEDETKYRAEMYNRRLSMESNGGRSTRIPREDTPKRRRPGYAYRYVDDDASPPVVDIEIDDVEDSAVRSSSIRDDLGAERLDSSVSNGKRRIKSPEEAAVSEERKKRSWMDRAQAVERVPPSGVAAWGPSGEIGLDARTKATLDALEEIREAKRKLEVREERVILAEENMIVVRADAELQKKRILATDGSRRARERLGQIEMEVDDASMALRRAKAQAAAARDRLSELEDRHWALLSLYDADKAFREVVETIQESELDQSSNDSIATEKATDKDKVATDGRVTVSPGDETKVADDAEHVSRDKTI